MKAQISILTLVSFLFFASSFTLPEETRFDWNRLGSKKVSYSLDRDVLHIGANDGLYSKLKLAVTGGSVNMHKMVVEYGNGAKDTIMIKQNFQKRTDSRVIDLQGNKRVIKKISFWYDTKNRSQRQATMHVFGK